MEPTNNWQKITVEGIHENLIRLIGTDWMLITAGTTDSFNTMTASWGTLGVLWNKPVSIIFIRPQRHTYQFANSHPYYTLSFFDSKYRDILNYCGSHSGKDVDKIKNTGLLPVQTDLGNIYFEQAKLVVECKKLYTDDLKENSFIELGLIRMHYPAKDFHRFFIGEIVNVFEKKSL
jgi:flavin reductase (DIM6/NTAB) family NADH-FMN oxidoreductase RutF